MSDRLHNCSKKDCYYCTTLNDHEASEILNRLKHYMELVGGFMEPENTEIDNVLFKAQSRVWIKERLIKIKPR